MSSATYEDTDTNNFRRQRGEEEAKERVKAWQEEEGGKVENTGSIDCHTEWRRRGGDEGQLGI